MDVFHPFLKILMKVFKGLFHKIDTLVYQTQEQNYFSSPCLNGKSHKGQRSESHKFKNPCDLKLLNMDSKNKAMSVFWKLFQQYCQSFIKQNIEGELTSLSLTYPVSEETLQIHYSLDGEKETCIALTWFLRFMFRRSIIPNSHLW